MTRYEFSLRQEVLLEKGAAVLADLFHYEHAMEAGERRDQIEQEYDRVWNAKHDILLAKTEEELARIEALFDEAIRFLEDQQRLMVDL